MRFLILAGALALGACDSGAIPERQQKKASAEAEPETVDIPQTVTALAPGTTPMNERVAVIGLLNKRNGISRELTLKPGQALRAGDVIVRLRACETAAPWEIQRLTGAFVQLDVRNPKGQFQRAFSGWLYKETPSLNAVEHPVYDVWPKSCAMTHPGASPPAESEDPVSKRSSAPKSAPPTTSASRAESSNPT
jgi:hypothetical protein